ncbi:MAG: STM4014 family protein [Lachnospiraceae bacterium]
MKVILLGEPDSKRTRFWMQAAKAAKLDAACLAWKNYEFGMLKDAFVKIDPPNLQTSDLHEMNEKLQQYRILLQQMQKENCRFLNTPDGILQLLDKSACKKRLQDAGISVTTLCFEMIKTLDDLLEQMRETHIYSVFIKPIYSSGAAGVTAFRFSPKTGRMVAYTSGILQDGVLLNTKKIRRMEQKDEIRALLNEIFSLDVIVERWIPKQKFQNQSYDLRIVQQFGKTAFCVARRSNGPITNLHLNNQALEISQLALSEEKKAELEGLCQSAMEQFPEIQMAGIDVLFEQSSGKPYVIEMNGQGDLIYQDIYHKNSIYLEQIAYIQSLIHTK